jgi:hypothetical protein
MILPVALVVTTGLFLWSFLHLLDAGFEIDDARSETRYQAEQALLLRSMLNHVSAGMERDTLLRLLADDMTGNQVVTTDPDRVEISSVVFRFRDGKVASVRLFNEDQ